MNSNSFTCRVCKSKNLKLFLDLGIQPWCNDFVDKDPECVEKYPLEVYFCKDCTTVQVKCTVPKEKMYDDHLYLSGTTKTMNDHFELVAQEVFDTFKLNKNSFVFDVGSNDGTFLSKFKAKGCKVLGIDPCFGASEIANKSGIKTINEYFNYEQAEKIRRKYGRASIISAANVFYHTEELHSICDGINSLLDKDGVFVIQGSYLPEIIEKNEFDIMYHEHLLLYRMETLDKLLKLHGLELFDAEMHRVHGGSFVAYANHINRREKSSSLKALIEYEKKNGYDKFTKYKEFAGNVKKIKTDLVKLINKLHNEGKKIYAFGAPAKGTVLINYCKLNDGKISLAVEKNNLKFNKFVPGSNIKVVDEYVVEEPDYYLLLAWNFALEILRKYRSSTKFILPFPTPHIVTGTRKTLDISVIIRCKDDMRVFDCIKSIDEDVEIIVSLPHNSEIESRLTNLGIKFINSPVGNLAITANNGVNAATNDKVIVMDCDSTFLPGCINELATNLDFYEVVRPKIRYLRNKAIPFSAVIGDTRAYVNEFPLAYTPGLAFKKSIREKIGGYIYDNQIPWAEDDDLSQRIFNAGIPVMFLEDAIVCHSPITLYHDLRAANRIGAGIRLGSIRNNRDSAENPINWIKRIFKGEPLMEFLDMVKVKGISVAFYNLLWSVFYYLGYYFRK